MACLARCCENAEVHSEQLCTKIVRSVDCDYAIKSINMLSAGALKDIMDGKSVQNAVLQLLSYKKKFDIVSENRWRLLISDGLSKCSYATLSHELDNMIDEELSRYSVFRVNKYVLKSVSLNGDIRSVLIISDLNIEVPGCKVRTIIGSPCKLLEHSKHRSNSAETTRHEGVASSKAFSENRVESTHVQESKAGPSGVINKPKSLIESNAGCSGVTKTSEVQIRSVQFCNIGIAALNLDEKENVDCLQKNQSGIQGSVHSKSEQSSNVSVLITSIKTIKRSNYWPHNDSADSPPVKKRREDDPDCVVKNPSSNIKQEPDSEKTVIKIADLMSNTKSWTIKAKVEHKSTIDKLNNDRGIIFFLELFDESGGIKCTGFTEACEKFYDHIQVGKQYLISGCAIKNSNPKYKKIEHPYELVLKDTSGCVPCEENKNDIDIANKSTPNSQNCGKKDAMEKSRIRSLGSVKRDELDTRINVMVIIISYTNLQTIPVGSSGRTTMKRDVEVTDLSNIHMTLTLWDQQAENFCYLKNTVILVNNVRVKEYRDAITLQSIRCTVITKMDSEAPESKRLIEWVTTSFSEKEAKPPLRLENNNECLKNLIPIANCLGKLEKEKTDKVICVIKGCFTCIQHEILYEACPKEGCNKKVIKIQNRAYYRCMKCNGKCINCKYMIRAKATISDYSGFLEVVMFREVVEQLLGKSADELGELQRNDPDLLIDEIEKLMFQDFLFKICLQTHTFNNMKEVNAIVKSANPMDRQAYASYLHEKIKLYMR